MADPKRPAADFSDIDSFMQDRSSASTGSEFDEIDSFMADRGKPSDQAASDQELNRVTSGKSPISAPENLGVTRPNLGPAPRSVAEGQVTDTSEQRQGAPLKIQTKKRPINSTVDVEETKAFPQAPPTVSIAQPSLPVSESDMQYSDSVLGVPLSDKERAELGRAAKERISDRIETIASGGAPVEGARLAGQYIQAEAQSMNPEEMEHPGLAQAYKDIIAPAGEAGAQFLEGQYHPQNLALLSLFSAIPSTTTAGRIIHGAAGAYFGSTMGAEGVVSGYEAYRAAEEGNVSDAVRKGVSSILNLGMAAEATLGASRMGSKQGAQAEAQKWNGGKAEENAKAFRQAIEAAGIELPPNATFEQAAAAYKEAIRKLHPDLNPDVDPQTAARLNELWTAAKGFGVYDVQANPSVNDLRASVADRLTRAWEWIKNAARGGESPTAAEANARGARATAEPVAQLPAEARPSAAEAAATAEVTDAIKTAAKADARDNLAAGLAQGQPIPAPPQPEQPQYPPVSDETLAEIGKNIAALPPEQRTQAITEAHDHLTQALLQQGKVVVGGKLYVVDSEKSASSTATKIINDQIKAHDEATKKPVEVPAPKETAETAQTPEETQSGAVTESPSQAVTPVTSEPPLPEGYTPVEESPAPAKAEKYEPKKGDVVSFTDNDGVERTGTVKYVGPLAVRLEDADGNKITVANSKVRGLAPQAPGYETGNPQPSTPTAATESPITETKSKKPETPKVGVRSESFYDYQTSLKTKGEKDYAKYVYDELRKGTNPDDLLKATDHRVGSKREDSIVRVIKEMVDHEKAKAEAPDEPEKDETNVAGYDRAKYIKIYEESKAKADALHEQDSDYSAGEDDPHTEFLRKLVNTIELLDREIKRNGETAVSEGLRKTIDHDIKRLEKYGDRAGTADETVDRQKSWAESLEIRGSQTKGWTVVDPATGRTVYTAGFSRELAEKFINDRLPKQEDKPNESEHKYKFGNTAVEVPGEIAEQVRAMGDAIPDDALMGDGRVPDSHITVKYGVHDSDKAVLQLREALADQAPIHITLGHIDSFEPSESSDGAAPVFVKINIARMRELRSKVAPALKDNAEPDTFPSYQPHITIAYVKPQMAKQIVEDLNAKFGRIAGRSFTIDRIKVTDRDGNAEVVKFGAPTASKPEAQSQAPTAPQSPKVSSGESVAQPAKKPAPPKKGNEHYPYNAGDVVVFSKIPPGSYLVAGDEYMITEVGSKTVYFKNVKTGGGTWENYRNLNLSKYEKVEAKPETSAVSAPEPTSKVDTESTIEPTQEAEDGRAETTSRGPVPTSGGRPLSNIESTGGGELAGEQPANGKPTGEAEQVAGSPDDSDGEGSTDLAPGGDQGTQPGSGSGVGDVRVADAESARKPARVKPRNTDWFEFPSDFSVDAGNSTRLGWNLNALKIVKKVLDEGYKLTDEDRDALAHFVGWGALQHVFDPAKSPWKEQQKWYQAKGELEELLDHDAMVRARNSTQNAHYTAPEVVRFMWDAAKRMGFKGGAVLEPAMGTGNFFGLMPKGIRNKVTAIGNELDPGTYQIAKLLYPSAQIYNLNYVDLILPDDSIDLAIGNPPFGVEIYDPKYRWFKGKIHDYFFIKTLDKVRPGGVVMFITSSGTLDKRESKIREALASKADLVTSFRLPSGTFDKNAGTAVTTDLIVLRKRMAGEEPKGEQWINTVAQDMPVENENRTMQGFINEYYVQHPENLLGTSILSKRMNISYRVSLKAEGKIQEKLKEALSRIPAGLFDKVQSNPVFQADTEAQFAKDNILEDQFTLDEKGQVAQRRNGVLVQPKSLQIGGKLSPDRILRAKAMIGLRDQVNELLSTMKTLPDTEEANKQIATLQKDLKKAYDAYVKRHGLLHELKSKQVFSEDPHYPRLLALEKYDRATKIGTPADIFTKRTIFPRQPLKAISADPKEGLYQVLAERGKVDLDLMAQLSGKPIDEISKSLSAEGLIYKEPLTGEWQTKDKYLTGFVRDKLRDAEKALAQGHKEFQANVDALKKVIPETIPINSGDPNKDIEVRLGATWIPTETIEDFIREELDGGDYRLKVQYLDGIWKVDNVRQSAKVINSDVGNGEFGADQLLELALNLKTPIAYDRVDDKAVVNQERTIQARQLQTRLQEKFSTWAKGNEKWAKQLEENYNYLYNGLVLPEYDGSHLQFPGMNAAVDLRPHQKSAIWRIIQDGRGLLAHVVGAGKTFEMAASAMELRRLGLAKKILIAVPNHLVQQWANEFLHLYPGASLLVATKADFETTNRRRFMAKLATTDFDAAIIAHSQFNLMDISKERQEKSLQAQMDELEETIRAATADSDGSQNSKRTVKQLEQAKDRLKARIDKLRDLRADRVINFDDTGVDTLIVDEAHEYKNLAFYTKMTRVAGLGQGDSKRAERLKMKTDYLLEKNNGRGVIFATGTPVQNTMAELNTMIKYVAPDVLEKYGIRFFDDWAANFGAVITAMELSADGRTYKPRSKFARFTNVPELMNMFRSFADIKTAADLNLPVPKLEGGAFEFVEVPSNEIIEPIVDALIDRARHIRGELQPRPKPDEDNMLAVTMDGRKVATDARLLGAHYPDHADSKINHAVKNIFKEWEDGRKERLTQLVFLDLFQLLDKGNEEVLDALAGQPGTRKGLIPLEDYKPVANITGYRKMWGSNLLELGSHLSNGHVLITADADVPNKIRLTLAAANPVDRPIAQDKIPALIDKYTKDKNLTPLKIEGVYNLKRKGEDPIEVAYLTGEDGKYIAVNAGYLEMVAKNVKYDRIAADVGGDNAAIFYQGDKVVAVVMGMRPDTVPTIEQAQKQVTRIQSNDTKAKKAKKVDKVVLNLYEDMRDKLVKMGVPKEEIAIIHEYPKETQKQALFDSMNTGKVRILMGSTQKMGAGMNVQRKLKSLHHIDLPWRPGDLEQRNGRIVRQGNQNAEVRVKFYATRKTFDAYMAQTLQGKAEFINQVMSGKYTGRTMTDAANDLVLSLEELKAIASGNPDVKRKMELEAEQARLLSLKQSHDSQQQQRTWDIRSKRRRAIDERAHADDAEKWLKKYQDFIGVTAEAEQELEDAEDRLEQIKQAIDKEKKSKEPDKDYIARGEKALEEQTAKVKDLRTKVKPNFEMEVLGKKFTDRKAALEYMKSAKVPDDAFEMTYNGVPVKVEILKKTWGGNFKPTLEFKLPWRGYYNDVTKTDNKGDAIPSSINMMALWRGIPAQIRASKYGDIEQPRRNAEIHDKEAADLEKIENKPFPEQAQLDKVQNELTEVNGRLGIGDVKKVASEEEVSADVDATPDPSEEEGEEDAEGDEAMQAAEGETAATRVTSEISPAVGKQAPEVHISTGAMKLILAVRNEAEKWHGNNVSRRWAEQTASKLNNYLLAKRQGMPQEMKRDIAKLASDLKTAAAKATDSGVSLIENASAAPEEGFHSIQRLYGKDSVVQHVSPETVDSLSAHPTAVKAFDYLRSSGYAKASNAMLVAELAAKIGTTNVGLFRAITPEEAAEWFDLYLTAIEQQHGTEAVEEFARIAQESIDRLLGGQDAQEVDTGGEERNRGVGADLEEGTQKPAQESLVGRDQAALSAENTASQGPLGVKASQPKQETAAGAIDDSLKILRRQATKKAADNGRLYKKNSGSFQGKPFFSGAVNAMDGVIEEVHPYERAKAADFNHEWYFSREQAEKLNSEETVFFWMHKGRPEFDWGSYKGKQSTPAEKAWLEKRVLEQLDTSDTITPPAKGGDDQALDRYAFEDEEMEREYQAAHGLQKEPLLQQMKDWAARLKNLSTRRFEFLPRGAQWEPARFGLVTLEHRKGGTREEAAESLSAILKDLNPDEYNQFERLVLLRDLKATADEGLTLPQGFTPENVAKELERLEAAVPTGKVRDSFNKRKAEQERIKNEYLKVFKDLGLDMSERMKRADYFRHQVLEYAQETGVFGSGRKLKAPTNRGFLKQREGSSKAINTDYLQAEYEYMAQVRYDIEMGKFIRDVVGGNYDILNSLKRAAVKQNESAVMELFRDLVRSEGETDSDIIDEEAGKRFRQTLNKKQSMAISRLMALAANGELPNGGGKNDFTDLIESLSDMHNEDAATKADMEENYEGPGKLDGRTIRALIRYAGWVLKSEQGDEAARAAALLFKGMKEKRQFIESALGDNMATWRDVVPDGYTVWQPKDGFQFFTTTSIPEVMAQKIEAGIMELMDVPKDKLVKVLARGGRFKQMVIPQELADTLDHLKPAVEIGPFGKVPAALTRAWKAWQLLSPRRFAKYNIRNLSGDAEAAFIGNPSTFSKVGQAASDLLAFFRNHHAKTPMLRAWIQRGGMETLLQAQEIGDINSLEIFKHLWEKKQKGAVQHRTAQLIAGVWKTARLSTDFREAILRYAAFLDYAEQMSGANRAPKNFGASIPAEVMALDDRHDRAFKLANDLLGAYDDISALGQWLRNYLPFWSFQEVNPKRYWRFFKNAFGEAGYGRTFDSQAAWKAFENVTGKSARFSPFLALKIGSLLLKMAALWGLLTAWNYSFFRDDEESLSNEVKDSPHVILGHGQDNVLVMPRLGNLPDVLDWVGIDAPQRNLAEWLDGRRSAKEVIANMAKGPVNKIWGAMTPLYKLPPELAFGKSAYPDVFNPRPVADRWDYLARQFALDSEYKALTGKPSRGYAKSVVGAFLNEYERGSGAYYEVLSDKRKFLESIGKPAGNDYAMSPRAEALRNIKLSIRFRDKQAWQKYVREYMALGGDEDNIGDAIDRLHPLGGLTADEAEAFVARMKPAQRDKLRRATEYYQRMIVQEQ